MLSRISAKLRDWIEGPNADAPLSAQYTTTRDFVTNISFLVTSLVSSIVATWIAQEILNYNFPAALVIGMVILLLLTTALQVKGLPVTLKPIQLLAFLLTLLAVQSTIIAYMYVSNQPSIVYLVFDATEDTSADFPELLQKTIFAAQVQDSQNLGGLRIYGGGLSDQTSCSDTTQLIAPIPAEEFEQRLYEAFDEFDPKGNASLTVAVLRALEG